MDGYSFSAVVQGALHKREGLECQDYAGSSDDQQPGVFIFSVSDGHGDPACIRSALGSQYAVEVALQCLNDFAQSRQVQDGSFNASKDEANLKELCATLVARWHERVMTHLESHPLPKEQWNALGERGQQIFKERPAHLYGATLVAGLATPRMLLLLQQGDGCCVVVDEKGNLSSPIPEDERCVGNVTTSLCDTDAAVRMRCCALDRHSLPAIACFVGSDGVDKSLWGTEGLYDLCNKLALDTLGNLNRQDMEASLKLLLSELSEMGCGDDASLAGFADVSRIACIAPTLVDNRVRFAVTSELEQLRAQLNSMKRMYERYSNNVSQSPEESARREVFLVEHEEVKRRIQELEGQLQTIGSGSEQSGASLTSSLMLTGKSVHIKPAAHFPKTYDPNRWESDEARVVAVQNEASGSQRMDEAVGVQSSGKSQGLQSPVEETPAPFEQVPQSATRGGSRWRFPAVVGVCLLMVVLVAVLAILLKTTLTGSSQVSEKTADGDQERTPVVVSSNAVAENSYGTELDTGSEGDAEEEIGRSVDEFLNALDISNEETRRYEQELELDSDTRSNELRRVAFGQNSHETYQLEFSPSRDVVLVKTSIECVNLNEVLVAELRESFDGNSIAMDSLVARAQNEAPRQAVHITLCMVHRDDGWDVWRPLSDDVVSKLLEQSGYLACLRALQEPRRQQDGLSAALPEDVSAQMGYELSQESELTYEGGE